MITITRIKYSNNINSVEKKKTYFNVNPPIAGGTPDSDRRRPRAEVESRGREPRSRAKAESFNGNTQKYLKRILCPCY